MTAARSHMADLVRCSAEMQRAHGRARDAGREDICRLIREAAWKIAAAISVLALDEGVEELAQ